MKKLLSFLLLFLLAVPAFAGYPSINYSFTNGTVADAGEVNTNNATLLNGYTAGTYTGNFADLKITSFSQNWTNAGRTVADLGTVTTADINGGTIDGITSANLGTITMATITSLESSSIPPIGSIIPFYDFDGNLTFDSNYWAYCDGSSKTVGALGAQTLPDLSNRYLVGFGTEGGGDIDTASWATAAVGAASHQVNLSHSHTGPSHSHAAGTLAGPSHTHTGGTLQFKIGQLGTEAGGYLTFYQLNGSIGINIRSNYDAGIGATNSIAHDGWVDNVSLYSVQSDTAGATGASGTGAVTGSTAAEGTGATSSSLSSTQSVQPRSVRVRYIMRVM